jgi:hypothetical protein
MNEPDILYPALFVFTMLLIGLALTVWEFSRPNRTIRPVSHRDKAVSRASPNRSDKRVA